ncbi:polysaccharide deacetylase family protein [Sphingomonas naphthae]|uniref:Polysaccharide deacetylase family protein n=1 Tax=Sphingomonas naphthae TaxID=1813468 RepID=A0ABY7TGE2_9SPHN|nr:polysaccharide deacetylase family protein [Sphingomonas naphthae]WCT72214.1 polysaccharide deacetylase family protein [Sphingomonas naphthae]
MRDDGGDTANRRRLIASIHDVCPAYADQTERLADILTETMGTARFAMLVVPHHWAGASLDADPVLRSRLRQWADQGVEMFLHGFTHRDDTRHAPGLAAWKARAMTAREGEFLGLDQIDAEHRMRDGLDMVEQAIGRPVAGFVAPAWLYSAGTREAMRRVRFRITEDHLRVWDPVGGATLARGPVVTWASRSRMRTASSLGVAALARATFGPLPTVRVAVHPGDVAKPEIVASIRRTLGHFAARRAPSRYADLRPAVAPDRRIVTA